MVDMSLISPPNSKFWWDLYIFPKLAVHCHLMPWNSSSKLIRISDGQETMVTIHLEHGNVKKSTVGGPRRTLRDRTTLHNCQASTSAGFPRSLVEIQIRCTQNYQLYFCTPIRIFVTFSFFLVSETTCIFLSPRSVIDTAWFISMLLGIGVFRITYQNRHINWLFLWIADKYFRNTQNV